MTEKLLQKFIENNVNSYEKENIISWIEKSPENQKKYNLLKARYVANTLKKVREKQHQKVFNLPYKYNRKKLAPSLSIAASITLILGFLLFYAINTDEKITPSEIVESNLSEIIEITTKNNLHQEIKLPDGSIVFLNTGSQITYPKIFNDSIREVTLIGEAFFDVAHNKSKPFIVKTEEFNIKVLGTTFNVKSYPEDKQIETVLVTGKVELIRKEEKLVLLAPSQKAIFDKEKKKIKITPSTSEDATAWKIGKLVFKETPFQQVVIDIQRKYNKKIIINSPKLLDYKYTGTFDDVTIEEVIQLLTISSPITYTLETNKIILNMK